MDLSASSLKLLQLTSVNNGERRGVWMRKCGRKALFEQELDVMFASLLSGGIEQAKKN